MESYKLELHNEMKTKVKSDNVSEREAFFNIYCEKLEQSEIIEDANYLYFKAIGSKSRNIQIDGYAYNELDNKLTLFVIPPLSHYETTTLTKSEADAFFKRAKYFYFGVKKIISEVEESSEGYGLAFDISEKKIEVSILEIVILTDYVKSKNITIIDSIYENDIRIDYAIFDISRVKSIDESIKGKEALVINLREDFQAAGIPVLPASKTDDYEAYLCNVPGELLAKIYNKYQSRLLEGNVRSFLQTKGKVNKNIRHTILNNPDMFFAYNNGIAATAESIDIVQTEKGLMITGFTALQIVNGGQTTASLANAWENDTRLQSQEQIKRIFVPMKISVISQDSPEDLIPNISRYANSQNKVSDADLASNHPFHIKFEGLSRRIHAPAIGGAQFGTFWYYERANGQYRQETYKSSEAMKRNFETKHPKNQMFKKVDLAKYYNIFLQKPHITSAGSQKSFLKFSEWMIKKWDSNSNFVNDEFFKEAIALCILFKNSDTLVRKQSWYDSYKANIVAYTLSLIFYKVSVDFPGSTIDLSKIWKEQKLPYGWIKQIESVSYLVYQHLIRTDRTVENVTEWAKREVCWTWAKEIDIAYDRDFINEIVTKDYIETKKNGAMKEQKQEEELNALVQVYEHGSAFWQELYDWNIREKCLNTIEVNLLKKALKIDDGTITTDKQALKLLEILEKARLDCFEK